METLTDKGPRQMFCSTNSKRQQMPDQTITSSRTFNHSRLKKNFQDKTNSKQHLSTNMQHRRYFSENINLKKLTTLKKTQEKNKIRPVKLRVGKMQTATTKKNGNP